MQPGNVPDSGLAPFFHAAGEIGVEAERLEQRIRRAHRLIYLLEGERLLGVCAIKVPAPSYCRRVFGGAGADDRRDAFPLEFGWLYVFPGERGAGHGGMLIAAGRRAVPDWGLFATVRADAEPLKRLFMRQGYAPLGGDYDSVLGDHRLSLLGSPPFRAAQR